MYQERSITEKQDRVQVMLEGVALDQWFLSSSIISSIETKLIDNIIEVHDHVLHHNENETPIHGAISE